MSHFKLICEDEATTVDGPSKIKQEFETEELSVILDHKTKFLHSSGYLFNNVKLTVERIITFDNE